MNSILNISINYNVNNTKKQEIYLEITKLLTPIVARNSFVVYETNTIFFDEIPHLNIINFSKKKMNV